MAPWLVPRLAVGVLFNGASSFSPFAGVEELRPQRLRDFCSHEVEDSKRGLRWCEHAFSTRLEDDGDIELSWRMLIDPDSVLSLDTEATEGVRVLRCSPGELELELPPSHMGHAEAGKFVVSSRYAHGCEHMPDQNMYRRVAEVRRRLPGTSTGHQRVHLATEDLPSFAHTVPSLTFSFSYMPAEARDVVPHPEMKTDFGLNRQYLQNRDRRLFSPFDFAKKLAKIKGASVDMGGFKSGGHSGRTINTNNGMLNFMPKQVSNFGWNWDFFMNTTKEPNYKVTIPGAQGVVKIRDPYVKIHSGVFLNFTSEFSGITAAPKVKWQFGMKGHGDIKGRVLAALNTTASADVDPIQKFDLPIFKDFHNAQWFEKVEFATGHMPISFEPGVKFNAKMYHKGAFHGGVAFGGQTHFEMNPLLSFDSRKGFDIDTSHTYPGTKLKDLEFIPPLWMIFTKRFEMGIMLMPMLLMRGDFAQLEKATFALEFRPYMNLTITRSGDNSSSEPDDEMRMLTVYPYRVMGITEVQFQKKYKVQIEALGQTMETSPQMNWGHVLFHDHVSKFSLGETTEQSVIAQAIKVSLVEVDETSAVPTERVLGSGQVQCTSLLNGVCHPSPPIAHIMQGTVEVAAVELAILWQNTPEPWFASEIRGVSVSFPQVVLHQDELSTAFPQSVDANGKQVTEALTMHLIHDGLTYTVPIQGNIYETGASLRGDTVVEFGPGFVSSWLPCSVAAGERCESPRLEMYYGRRQVAVANLPMIEWTSQTAMQGTKNNFMARSDTMNVPCSVVLYAPGSTTTTIAVVTMNAQVVSPGAASFVLAPSSATKVPLSSTMDVMWTMSEVDKSQSYPFVLEPLKLVNVVPSQLQNYVTYRKVGNQVLVEVANHSEAFTTTCSSVAIGGMAAADAPCSFSHRMPIGRGFVVGDQAVIRIEWSKDGKRHETYSPPFVIVSTATARRLNEPPAQTASVPFRQLFSKEGWNNRISQHADSCSKKDLHFALGAGMLFRGRVDNVGVPKGFPMLGGLDEAPTLTTGFRKIAGMKPGKDAPDLLPADLCKGGLCNGALPGCQEADQYKKQFFPVLYLNYSRPYHYDMRKKKGKFHGLMKTALAYAFSTLPEVVDVWTREMNQTSHGTPAPTTALPFYTTVGPGAAAGVQWKTDHLEGTPFPRTTTVPTQSPHDQEPEAGSAFKKWWSGAARRLGVASSSVNSLVQDQKNLADNQVMITFREGLPFKIDRELVERMLLNGYFLDVEDDLSEELGPLQISSLFDIRDLAEEGDSLGTTASVGRDPLRATGDTLPVPTHSLAVLMATVSGVCLAASFLAKRVNRRGMKDAFSVLPMSPMHPSGLE